MYIKNENRTLLFFVVNLLWMVFVVLLITAFSIQSVALFGYSPFQYSAIQELKLFAILMSVIFTGGASFSVNLLLGFSAIALFFGIILFGVFLFSSENKNKVIVTAPFVPNEGLLASSDHHDTVFKTFHDNLLFEKPSSPLHRSSKEKSHLNRSHTQKCIL